MFEASIHAQMIRTQNMYQKIRSEIQTDQVVCDKVMIALRKIIRAIDMNSKNLVKRVGLTGPQLLILMEISRKDGITPGEIARAVSLSQATVTGILERMEKRQLITRRRSQSDKRRILVSLTEGGEQTIKDAPPLMQEGFVERFTGLDEWEQTMILSSLQHLVSLMKARAIDAAPFLETTSFESQIDRLADPPPSNK
jgi:DNA-binding MarR family transcriptional regulator